MGGGPSGAFPAKLWLVLLFSSGLPLAGDALLSAQAPDAGAPAAAPQFPLRLPENWFDMDGPPLPQPPPPPREFDRVNINGLTFDDLKFGIEVGEAFQREMLTENLLRLDGLKIRIRGYIKPSFKQSGLEKFVFVRDNQECCFGPGAALYDCILVEMAKNRATDFSVRPVAVVGRFYLQEYTGPDGNVWAIFRMRDAVVE